MSGTYSGSFSGFDLGSSDGTALILCSRSPSGELFLTDLTLDGGEWRGIYPAFKAEEPKIPLADRIFAKLIGYDPDAPAPSPLLPALTTREILESHGMLAARRRGR